MKKKKIKIISYVCFLFVIVFLPWKKIYSKEMTDRAILPVALKMLHPGEIIYIYTYDIEGDQGPEFTERIPATKDKYERVLIKKVNIEDSTINGADAGDPGIKINGNFIDVGNIYVQIQSIYVNLRYWITENLSDPKFDEVEQIDHPEVVYFDSLGAHHDPNRVCVGKIGKRKILLSYTILDKKLVGCYRYLDSTFDSRVFEGSLVRGGVLSLITLKNPGQEKMEFKGKLEGCAISGIWKSKKNSLDMEVNSIMRPARFIGSYENSEDEDSMMYLTMNDSGIYLLDHEYVGAQQQWEAEAFAYPSADGGLMWRGRDGAKDTCWEEIYLKDKLLNIPFKGCYAENINGSDLSGNFKKIK